MVAAAELGRASVASVGRAHVAGAYNDEFNSAAHRRAHLMLVAPDGGSAPDDGGAKTAAADAILVSR